MTVHELAERNSITELRTEDGEVYKGKLDGKDIYLMVDIGEPEERLTAFIYNDRRYDCCEECGKLAPIQEITFSRLYQKNLCESCDARLAIDMVECDRQLMASGDL